MIVTLNNGAWTYLKNNIRFPIKLDDQIFETIEKLGEELKQENIRNLANESFKKDKPELKEFTKLNEKVLAKYHKGDKDALTRLKKKKFHQLFLDLTALP